jgi:hypothetical protein
MKSKGILRYSPKLLGEKSSDKWWVVLDCDDAIGKYYRHLFNLESFNCQTLQRPAWREHVTVIRDEEPPEDRKQFWNKYAGLTVEYEYHLPPQTNGIYWWLSVSCDFLLNLREELGLAKMPSIPLHLSFAHNKEI